MYMQHRIAKRDGEIIQQTRAVTAVIKGKWWKPWANEIEFVFGDWFEYPIAVLHTLRIGDRVQVLQTAGFHKGATGVVEFIEPNGRKVWVTRDNSGSPVYYHRDELELIWRRPNNETNAGN